MVSCVRDVEIDLEDLPDRIVLNASVCPGKEVCAHLSKTWFIMDSVPDFELSDAKVRVYVNDEFQGLMRNDDLPAICSARLFRETGGLFAYRGRGRWV